VLKSEQAETPWLLGMEHRTEGQCKLAIQQVLPVGNVPHHHGGFRRARIL
jgi:hypothetical protein